MYYVIGANGHQYGPVDEETLRGWARDGRVAAMSYAFRSGETEWAPLGSRAEFRALFPETPAPPLALAPPVLDAGGRDWLVALLLSIFLGYFGVDRFYMGQIGFGIAKLLTGGGCGIWYLVDIILIATGTARDKEGRHLVKSGI